MERHDVLSTYLTDVYVAILGLVTFMVSGCVSAEYIVSYLGYKSFLILFIPFGCIGGIHYYHHISNFKQTLCAWGMAYFLGVPLGLRLVDVPLDIILQATLLTICVFVSFTIISLFTPRPHILAYGGPLLASIFFIIMALILNIFINNTIFFTLINYFSLIVYSLIVVYDTTLIIEKWHHGERCVMLSAVTLFLDLINIFHDLLDILEKKDLNKNKNKNKN